MDKLFRHVRLSVSISSLITLCLGLGLTALLFASVRRVESETRNREFQQAAKLRTVAVAGGLADAAEQLLVLNQLFRSMGTVSREQFHLFTAPLLQRYPEIEALTFERLVRQRDGAESNLIEFIEPGAGNAGRLGHDLALPADASGARARSRSSGKIAATGLLPLRAPPGRGPGFMVLAPVYAPGAPLGSAAERERAVIGETGASFRVDHLINTILRSRDLLDTPGIAIGIYAASQADASKLAFRNGAAKLEEHAIPLIPRWLLFDRADPLGADFMVAGSPWHMVVARTAVPFTATHSGSLYALTLGLLCSLLMAAYIYVLVSRAAAIERIASERTASLQFANLRLSEDLALRKHTEKSLRLRERVIEVSANAIIICSAEGPEHAIEYVNPAFERITGYSAAEVVGRGLEWLKGASQDQHDIEEIRAALREQREGRALLRNYRKDGSAFWNELFVAPVHNDDGAVSHFVVAQYDITAVMRFEAELEFQAKHDNLTGLANRNLLAERLNLEIHNAKVSQQPIWVVFVDLDRFKYVNDTLGHGAGDTLLKMLAARLQAATRDADTVARLGGDEFVLVLPGQQDDVGGNAVLQRIMREVAEPLQIDDHEFFLTCSMGVAVYPADGEDADLLIKHADIAMYRAKEMGRNTYQFYTPEMNLRTLERLTIETDLRHALERDEFTLHYQPQLDLCSGQVVGMEALIRWQHPVLGLIGPGRFIGLAEEMGLIGPIGDWVLRTACIQTKEWQLAGMGNLRIAVNLSARQFTQKGLVHSVTEVLLETGLEARYLELELTESMVMTDVDNAIAILRKLKNIGVQISIDDFGTGYSSLSYLRRFPIDVLKIDQSFVKDLHTDSDAAAIVVAIISLAHSLRLEVIAEGVETIEQLEFLREQGCDQMQGYYFSRPLGADAFEALIERRDCLPALELA